ncbi:MAG: 4Fe-4S dicluster domain-containing protein [Chloroflexi bacterium]|nr:4Fe-4S dicluster domain-containing protein [Chloroflexota bacterium]MDL1883169.1 4Fe-4S dicluster domain-containing protein [Anaerolineae bacterium CFX8]
MTERVDRRNFLRGLGSAIGAALAADNFDRLAAVPEQALAAYEAALAQADEANAEDLDTIERMRRELVRALQKPPSERRWVMVIDLRKCIGCHACTIACVAENKLPPGVVYRPVLDEEFGTYPNVTRRFTPRPCMQCDNPPCTPVCPVTATYKNEEGVVVVDYDQCIGCRACLTACPYGARTSDFGLTYTEEMPVAEGLIAGRTTTETYERAANFEYSQPHPRVERTSPIGNARKCHFCLHRVKVGELPACVTTCIGRATMFGDANDPDSLVAEMVNKPNVMRLKEELGTEPRVYYLV